MNESISRMDTGRGLLLKGNGRGDFTPITGTESGIKIYGEQRGAALSDINDDGKVDLVVSQNGAETKLFLNDTEKEGYRITLKGPESNRNGIGSSIRLVYESESKGPRREIQSGSGYWSQSSYTQVMGFSDNVKAIEVRWFDGTDQTVPVADENLEYVISYPK